MLKRAFAILCVLGAIGFAGWRYVSQRRPPEPAALLGLWMEKDVHGPEDELRFYYFHDGGKGLYRYGQVSYNQTHSFDWQLEGDQLTLSFRKRGERAVTSLTIGEQDGRRVITLAADPRGNGRYRHVPANLAMNVLVGALTLPQTLTHGEATSAAGRMWIDARQFATGGMGFTFYQLSEHPAQAGWRIGWHHAGDFDDWTTELLSYRVDAAALRLHFQLRDEDAVSPMKLAGTGDGRTLTLERDPRNFLAPTRFVDAGPSF